MTRCRIRRFSAAIAVLCFFAVSLSSRVSENPVRNFLEKQNAALIKEYSDFLSIPDVASEAGNMRLNAAAIVGMFKARGVAVRLLEGEGCPPLVFGEIKVPGARRTVIFYAHYDGQPVDAAQWQGDPWHAVLRDGRLDQGGRIIAASEVVFDGTRDDRLYARSASDDKAPIMALAAALDYLNGEKTAPSVNVKFIFEGEEEAGSPHLLSLLRKYRDLLVGDVLFICDGPVDQTGRMVIDYGARGTLGLELTVYGPDHPLHSGHYGNWAPNPVALLAHLLASMRDDDGRVLIDKFYDGVRPVSKSDRQAILELPDIDDRLRQEYGLARTESGNARLAERILLPALNFRGVQSGGVGEKAANAIPSLARASIDFRLVPDQEPESVKRIVEAHLAKMGFHLLRRDPGPEDRAKFARLIHVQWEEGYPPYRLSLDDPWGTRVAGVLAGALPEPPLRVPALGGSVPMRLFADELRVPVMGLPIANYDNNQHGPNENIRLQNLWDGVAMFAALLSGLGRAR
jgi:acetylornithine deacetylase/succinyl-diaminopimelate desuccinylase-like protein